MPKINLNETVKVRLTPHGRELMYDYYFRIYYDYGGPIPERYSDPSLIDPEQTMQLWRLLKIFGSHIANGTRAAFEGNDIQLSPDSLRFEDSPETLESVMWDHHALGL